MAKKPKNKQVVGKGLKGALSKHFINEQLKQNRQQAAKEAITKKADKEKSIKSGKSKGSKKQQHNIKALIPFERHETLLLIGEGDFSFASSIIKGQQIEPKNLIATSFDSKEEVLTKYPGAEEHIQFLIDEGVNVLHQVDATNIPFTMKLVNANRKRTSVKLFNPYKKLNHIMFNFPHTGRGMKDVDRNVRDHQKLVLAYFKSANDLLSMVNQEATNDLGGYGESQNETKADVILSLFEGEPYISWGVKALARSEGLSVNQSGKFEWAAFEGYHHKRTNGIRDTTKPAAERDARIYIFDTTNQAPTKNKGNKGNKGKAKAKNESDSDDD
ncbi:hypothetical protein FT663_04799 [Candidozyma haemuli var. vulneris]|uniref:25S rRNA (uridine-N(3))-methyltransferase BMT5-like domain-containing protein n=1 Tax=Candidozyma haemuli TaxID=45357 RepID=A0A2V1AXM9_9ASCO|nr:hypothetical protein CXQ85_002584 [[Candida] haemuloni]KAF3986447.1 hypothetical protein FT662_04558 [[Candida] haemuloni var. vulneris]KAF3986637.1 hypothetical protein FT663_04799 [[Candida] haemuloni var. vulneris]PVH22860.1 hypothetical protein CXQ85_002584 [[Candida] haemuloni]